MQSPKVIQVALFTKQDMASYQEIASMYGRGEEARKIPLDKIVVRAGFNHRIAFGDIRSLADYLLNGGVVPPINVDILKDGTAVLIEGERRVRAHLLLVSEGHEKFNVIQAFRSPASFSEQERVIKSIASNNNKQFEPLELANAFQDLRTIYGMSNVEIANATGHSAMHVSNMLRLAGVTDEEKELIQQGAVSSTAVLDMLKSGMAPGARLDAVKDAAGSGGSDGKGKLKVKDVPILGDLVTKPLDDKDTPESLIKGLLIHVKALDRLIGTDSKMSDITFKIDAELRQLKTLITTKYEKVPDGNTRNRSDVIPGDLKWKPGLLPLDPMFEEAALALYGNNFTGTGLNHWMQAHDVNEVRIGHIFDQLVHAKILSPKRQGLEQLRQITDSITLHERIKLFKEINKTDDQPF